MSDTKALLRLLGEFRRTAEVGTALATVSIILRMYTRIRILQKVGVDDYAAVAAWACFVATAAIAIPVVEQVDAIFSGKPFKLNLIDAYLKAATILYAAAMAWLKVSLGAFFLRFFNHYTAQRYLIYIVMAVTVSLSTVYGAYTGASCGVLAGFIGSESICKAWLPYHYVGTIWSICNAIGDVALALIAINALKLTQMNRSTMFYATMILLLGTVGGIASIIRISLISGGNHGTIQGALAGLWTLLEMLIGCLATNFACLRPLLREIRDKFWPESASGDDASSDSGGVVEAKSGSGEQVARRGPDTLLLMSVSDKTQTSVTASRMTDDVDEASGGHSQP